MIHSSFIVSLIHFSNTHVILILGLTHGHATQTEKVASNDGYYVHGHSGGMIM